MEFISAQARLGIGWARAGLGSARLGSSWPGLGSALPVSAWLHLARPVLAWPGSPRAGSARFRPGGPGKVVGGQGKPGGAGGGRNL